MRRGALAVLAVAVGLVAVPVALPLPQKSSTLVPVRVSPSTGSPHTTFSVSLRIPSQTGTSGFIRRTDTLAVDDPHHSGCVGAAQMTLPAAAADTMVRIRLIPSRLGGHWCTGRFGGVVTETEQTSCPPEKGCPLFVVAPRTIARFHFRVRRTG